MEYLSQKLKFNNQKALRRLIELICQHEQIKLIIREYINKINRGLIKKDKDNLLSIGEWDKMSLYLQTGCALKEIGKITNKKLIYDLHRRSISEELNKREEDDYYLDQCQSLFSLVKEVSSQTDEVMIEMENGQIEQLAEIYTINRNTPGRKFGVIVTKKDSPIKVETLVNPLITKFHKSQAQWNKMSNAIQANLTNNTFSLYYYVEYKSFTINKNSRYKDKIIEIRRGLMTFGESSTCKVFLLGNSKREVREYQIEYKIHPVGLAKYVLQTNEILLDNGSQMTFFVELGSEIQFQDFALGYYQELHPSDDFKIGTSILVKEFDKDEENGESGEEKSKIENQKNIIYKDKDLQEIPVAVLRDYFLERNQNFLKPPTIDDRKIFKNLVIKINKSKNKPKEITAYEYDGYISTPITSDFKKKYSKISTLEEKNEIQRFNKSLYEEKQAICYKIIKLFDDEILFYIANQKTFKDFTDESETKTFVDDNIRKITKSKYFVLIIPQLNLENYRTSKCFMELGIAIFLKRPTLILCDESTKNLLPKNIKKSTETIFFDSESLDSDAERIQNEILEWMAKIKM